MGIVNKHGVIEGGEDILVFYVEGIGRAVVTVAEYKGFWFYGINLDWRGPEMGGYGFAPSINDKCFKGCLLRSDAVRFAKTDMIKNLKRKLDRASNDSMNKFLLPIIAACEQQSLFDGFCS